MDSLRSLSNFHKICFSRWTSPVYQLHSTNSAATESHASIATWINRHRVRLTAKKWKTFVHEFFLPYNSLNVANSDFFTTGRENFLQWRKQRKEKSSASEKSIDNVTIHEVCVHALSASFSLRKFPSRTEAKQALQVYLLVPLSLKDSIHKSASS